MTEGPQDRALLLRRDLQGREGDVGPQEVVAGGPQVGGSKNHRVVECDPLVAETHLRRSLSAVAFAGDVRLPPVRHLPDSKAGFVEHVLKLQVLGAQRVEREARRRMAAVDDDRAVFVLALLDLHPVQDPLAHREQELACGDRRSEEAVREPVGLVGAQL